MNSVPHAPVCENTRMNITKRTVYFFGVICLALASACRVTTPAIHTNEIIRAPYVQLATPESIYVVWRTDGDITPVVRYGKTPDRPDQKVSGKAILTRIAPDKGAAAARKKIARLHSAPAGTSQYEAHLTGLKPDTRYDYAVYDGEKRLAGGDESYHFTTPPAQGADKPMRFWVVGDSGNGGQIQAAVHWAMVNLTANENHPIDFFLHVGDMAYGKGTESEFQKFFFAMYEPTLRHTVFWPAMGNHEGSTSRGSTGVGPYYDAFVLPTNGEAGGVASGKEAFYAFDFGRAHFISLDSHDLDRKPTGPMARWLQADLERTKADWVIAYWHHAPYTKGSHDSDKESQIAEMRSFILPILEAGGVDLVLTGHSHIYERSMLMDGAYATPTVAEKVILDDGDGDPNGDGAYKKSAGRHPHEGTVQVVAGNGGGNLNRRGTMPVMRKTIVEHGSVMVDINGDTLTAFMLNKLGEKRDTFSIVKRGKVTPTRIAKPWQPPYWAPPKSLEKQKADDDD